MKTEESSKSEMKAVEIRAELFNQLRKYCDHQNIRFKYFVEDALENAMYGDDSVNALQKEIEILKKKVTTYEYAFRRGFQKGFCFALFAAHEKIFSGLEDDELDFLQRDWFKGIEGAQLSLFR